ncbi:hypothetical protein H4R34_001063 [Dimargaris verticillata]|uniref:Uncharacterized protein n=1 Tax=Dimargaris verticillata TaxID=2761393 RepID=A0A9W8EE48_9FUNG|nr:hypothetical protein H4R34_001063 [Dimargaris verticillata]
MGHHSKKRKNHHRDSHYSADHSARDDTYNSSETTQGQTRFTAASKGRKYTVSIALPGSIIDNAQTAELRTYLAGQIGRAAAVFNVDEIVVYDDHQGHAKHASYSNRQDKMSGVFESAAQQTDPNAFLARVLQYLEAPQYLRKDLFPIHRDLKYAGLLNPLDCPHHVRADEPSPYREGVTVTKGYTDSHQGWANCGLRNYVRVDRMLKPGIRVTVQMDDPFLRGAKHLSGKVVARRVPREQDGFYWGYQVRVADSLSTVFSECPFKGGYDVTIGTSERGSSIDTVTESLPNFE